MEAQSDLICRSEEKAAAWMAHHAVVITRIALGLIYLWFGVLKFEPGLSEAEDLARRTLAAVTLGLLSPNLCLYGLAVWECAIGVSLLLGRFLKVAIVLLFLQLIGTFLPLLLFPEETWKAFPFAPTLEGQYIIKNFALIASAMVVGATLMGGKIVANAYVARWAERLERHRNRVRDRAPSQSSEMLH
jgi:uncharacterized membrane protein YphA (DoxX/SURF4 family)